jgi:hypothetical protein
MSLYIPFTLATVSGPPPRSGLSPVLAASFGLPSIAELGNHDLNMMISFSRFGSGSEDSLV